MNAIGSLMLFAIFTVAFILIAEIFTVLFRMTGLTEEKARLQVISMLTNSGFTTSESEIAVTSKRRRKLTRVTLLFGYSFTVIIVSLVVNAFLELNKTEIHNWFAFGFTLLITIGFILVLSKLKRIKAAFDHIIEKWGNRIMFGKGSNPVVIIDIYGNKVMAEVDLSNVPEQFENIPLMETNLKEKYNIQILLIKRKGDLIDVINGTTMLQKDDFIVVFGEYKSIRQLFEHPVRE